MNGRKLLSSRFLAIVIVLFLSVLISCLQGCRSKNVAVGKYEYTNKYHKVSLVLNADHTFLQVAEDASGWKERISGTWQQRARAVVFSSFFYSVDMVNGQILSQPQLISDSEVRGAVLEDAILISERSNYCFLLKK